MWPCGHVGVWFSRSCCLGCDHRHPSNIRNPPLFPFETGWHARRWSSRHEQHASAPHRTAAASVRIITTSHATLLQYTADCLCVHGEPQAASQRQDLLFAPGQHAAQFGQTARKSSCTINHTMYSYDIEIPAISSGGKAQGVQLQKYNSKAGTPSTHTLPTPRPPPHDRRCCCLFLSASRRAYSRYSKNLAPASN